MKLLTHTPHWYRKTYTLTAARSQNCEQKHINRFQASVRSREHADILDSYHFQFLMMLNNDFILIHRITFQKPVLLLPTLAIYFFSESNAIARDTLLLEIPVRNES